MGKENYWGLANPGTLGTCGTVPLSPVPGNEGKPGSRTRFPRVSRDLGNVEKGEDAFGGLLPGFSHW